MKKICVITGTRAEYGMLRWLMQGIKDDHELALQVIATGMHLSPEFGLTFREIERDGFFIDRKVEILTSSDTHIGTIKSMGLGLIGFADAFAELKPDLILVLGDRFEIFSAASAALVARIPVAHVHGGELTEGVIDEAFRHSITKMSHLHFVAAESYRRRVMQLGEHPDRIFLVGGLGVESIKRMQLLDKASLEASLDFKFGDKNLLVTFHPVTLEEDTALVQLGEIFAAIGTLKDTKILFTMPNADPGGRAIMHAIESFVSINPNTRLYSSLGQLRYFSCVAQVDGVIGNSSSGLLEIPSLKKGTINIGNRQQGRLKASSVIDCEPERSSIISALRRLYSSDFQDSLIQVLNPYGDEYSSDKIVSILKKVSLDGIVKKQFYDLP
jgi:GDP/UDP-N,N'-diacetylbacillosamine 2-epimerase (hydrolysing)